MRRRPYQTGAGPASLVDVLCTRARDQAAAPAFAFLADGDAAEDGVRQVVTYGALDQGARAVAAALQERMPAGERALLLFPPGLEFISAFFGCLYAGVVAVPSNLPRPNRPMPRLGAVVADARPTVVLTTAALRPDAGRWAAGVPALGALDTMAVDAVEPGLADAWRDPEAEPDRLAFLQYTSGSTSTPKGVMVSHGNILANMRAINASFGATADSRGVFWLPLFHDMGLIGGVLQTLYCGGWSTLMSPVAFLQRPLRWLQAISATGATISGGPDFAYDLCVRKIGAEAKAGLDLSRWDVAFNGAEPVRVETLDRFAEAFAPCGFRREAFLPCYGMAEATLFVSGRRARREPAVLSASATALAADRVAPPASEADGRRLAASGALPEETEVAIADPARGARCEAGRVGEIWVRGPSVAEGYWNAAEATAETFGATLADDPGGPFLRTGDLGFLDDGHLFVTGRIKDLVIVGGRNIYPQDVEWTVERCHPLLRPLGAAVFSVEAEGREQVVVVQEVERLGKGRPVEPIIAAIRQAVAEAHDLDLYAVRLIRPLSLPKTSSGKVQRLACRDAFLDESLDVVGGWTRPEVGPGRFSPPEHSAPGSQAEDMQTAPPAYTAAEVAGWLAARVAASLGVPAAEVDHRLPLAAYGLGSVQAVALAGELETWLGRSLAPTLVYEYPTIAELARHLADGVEPRGGPIVEPVGAGAGAAAIAVVGIGCRFPGGAGPEAFWRLLIEGVDAVGPVPPGRWAAGQVGTGPGACRIDLDRGGFLPAVDLFDADFFGVAPREAVRMDPQQRLLLEVAWEALEDAGQAVERLAGTAVGVFVGIATDDYSRLAPAGGGGRDGYAITGNAASIAANRISYALDFRGPSLAVDTACSSSLVAAHLACQSLRSGESSLALACGVNLILAPHVSADFARAGFLAPDGRCKTFSADADGYARGEGVGVVVLKRLDRALADGDPIYAVIRGGAVNQDGRSNGLTAPNRQAQEAVLRAAYRAAGIAPGQVGYVEAHGTGTLLGDPIEAAALGAVLAEGRSSGQRCVLGSVKTNIGHLEAAAGIAGLIKVALMLHHRAIPPSLHCREPNPRIPFDALPLRLASEPAPWPDGAPAIAGVSSFGFGGTNAHLVLEAAPPRDGAGPRTISDPEEHVLTLSARDPEALRELARAYRAAVSAGDGPGPVGRQSSIDGSIRVAGAESSTPRSLLRPEDRGILPQPPRVLLTRQSKVDVALGDLAYASALRRDHHDHRLAVVAAHAGEAVTALDAFLRGETHPDLAVGRRPPGRRPGLVFVFAGQGGFRVGAGRELLAREPIVRAVYEECDRWLMANAGRSLVAELGGEPDAAAAADPEFAQTHQFALQVALAALWRSWGVVPDAVVGHSLGEVAAAHVAGALGLTDALRIAWLRGRLTRQVAGRGATAALGLSVAEAGRRLESHAGVTIAADNGPGSTTVSGDPAAVDALLAELRAEGLFVRRLDVDVAFHSPQLEPLAAELADALRRADLAARPAVVPFVSTVTGRVAGPGELDAAYWGRNLRDPVQFGPAIDLLSDGPYETFLEIGPHPIHAVAIAACLAARGRTATLACSLRRGDGERRPLLRGLAALHAHGHPVDWTPLVAGGRATRLPTYPWRHERFWVDEVATPLPLAGEALAGRNGSEEQAGNNFPESCSAVLCATGSASAEHVPNAHWQSQWHTSSESESYSRSVPTSGNGAPRAAADLTGLLHAIRWQDDPGAAPSGLGLAGRWLVLPDAGKTGAALLAALGAAGARVAPGALEEALDAARGEIRGVVDLRALDAPEPGSDFGADAVEVQARVCGAVLDLFERIARRGGDRPPRVWLVTRGAEPAGDGPAPLALAQAPLWGLGRSLALDHPDLWGGLVDLDPDPDAAPDAEGSALAEELGRARGDDQVAFRGGRRRVARLVPLDSDDRPDAQTSLAPTFRPEGTYLVTGGLGRLGLLVARWMVEHGARRLVLVGRHDLPDRGEWATLPSTHPARPRVEAVESLERLGATVLVAPADVADRPAMAALLERLRRTLPPLRGVVHAAGVVEAQDGRAVDEATLRAALRPKLAGALVLHELTRALPLDVFVMFSSIVSVVGSRKRSDYATANHALDALAHHRAALGLPALSINWGPWDEGGMAADSGSTAALAPLGLTPLAPGVGLAALGRLMARATPQAVAARVNWSTFAALHGRGGVAPLLREVAGRPGSPVPVGSSGHADPSRWLGTDPDPARRHERLAEYLRERVARVLGLPPGKLDPDRPLNTLGLDSLMAMELRAGIAVELGAAPALTSLLDGASVDRLAELTLARLDASCGDVTAPAAEAGTSDHAAALSAAQQTMWYAQQLAPDASSYNIAGAVRVVSGLDVLALRRGFDRLLARHEALRTTFPAVDGRPTARVVEEAAGCVAVVDATGWTDAELERRREEEARRPIDLERGPLVRLVVWTRSGREHDVLLVVHHIVADFWTVSVIVDELGQFYAAESTGVDPGLEPLRLRFSDHVRWQADRLAGPEGERLWAYWKGQLAGPLPALDLPFDRPRPAVRSGGGAVRACVLDADLARGLSDLGGTRGTTLYTVLLTGLHALLARLGGLDDVIVGSPVAGRTRPELVGLVGHFINLVPMRADLSGDPTFEALLTRMRGVVHEALEHQELPYSQMVQRLGLAADMSRTPLFQVLLVHQKAPRLGGQGLTSLSLSLGGLRLELGELTLESLPVHSGGAAFDLTLMTAPAADGRLEMSLEYSTDLFDAGTADRFLATYRTLLAAAVADPSRRLSHLPLLDEAERHRVLVEWGSDPAADPPAATTCVHQLFEAQARRTPGAEALVAGNERLSYAVLNERANRLAHHLRGLGVRPGTLVGLRAGRTPALWVGLLGILKAGGAYAPIDPSWPDGRIAQVLDDARPEVLVTDSPLPVPARAAVVDLVADAAACVGRPATNPEPWATPGDLAYVIYTSGSTGRPKGVMVSHAAIACAGRGWERAYGLALWPARHLQMAGSAFDVFTGDWVRALCHGGALVACPRELLFDPEALYDLMVHERVDCAEFVPASIEGLVAWLEKAGRPLDFMRLVAIGSDRLHAGLYERVRRLCGPSARVVNSYGLTEAAVDSTYFEGDLSAAPPDRPAPVGRPFPGTCVDVLDRFLQPVPVGMPGELYVGGGGLARGYLNRPALTAERFLPDPFAGRPGARLYRTGDLARWRPDGALELIGRADRQVKVRGHRVEPDEIESVLRGHPGVAAAAVVVREDRPGDRRLAAYVVAAASAADPAPDDLRRWLKGRLPEPMVPATITRLLALPLSANGKVDHRALAALAAPAAAGGDHAAGGASAPRTAVEELLARILADVSGLGAVAVHDNFFDLGVDSIGVIQLVARARQAGLRLDPALVFRHPSVAELAAACQAAPAPEPGPPTVDLLAGLDRDALLRPLESATVDDLYPLSPVQEGMVFHARLEPDAGVYIDQFTCRVRGPLDVAAFERSWRRLLTRHPALRTAVHRLESERPLQAVFRRVELPVDRQDWRGLDPATRAERLAAYLRDDRRRGFDLERPPLLRLALLRLDDDLVQVVWTTHHLVFDGWCLPLLMDEVLAGYEAELAAAPLALAPCRPFRDYIAWVAQQDLAPAETFWRRTLAGVRAATPLGIDRPATPGPGHGHGNGHAGGAAGPKFAGCERSLDADATARLVEVARAGRVTLAALIDGLWALLLARYSGRADVVFGVTVSGRPPALDGVESMVGVLINTIPLRVAVDEEATLLPWLREVQERLAAARRFEHTPPVQVRQWSEVPPGRPLFESIVIVQNTPVSPALRARAGRLGIEDPCIHEQTSYPLTLSIVPGERLLIRVGYDTRRIDAQAAARLAGHLATLLAAAASDPFRRLADLEMLTTTEQQLLTSRWPDEAPDPSASASASVDLDRLGENELDALIAAVRRSIEDGAS
jgi:amino acid adenylation domain-containing protein